MGGVGGWGGVMAMFDLFIIQLALFCHPPNASWYKLEALYVKQSSVCVVVMESFCRKAMW